MALKIWFEEDLANAVSAAALAADLLPNTTSPQDEAYVRGYNAAIRVLCTSFGMRLPVRELAPQELTLQVDNNVRCFVVDPISQTLRTVLREEAAVQTADS